jgi:hypothetical protein
MLTRKYITNMDAWYSVTTQTVARLGASGVISKYNNSLPQGNISSLSKSDEKALKSIYPDHPWEASRFKNVRPSDIKPYGYWTNIDNQRAFMEQLAKRLQIQHLDDWYEVKTEAVVKNGGMMLLAHYHGSLRGALQTIYPDHPWDNTKFRSKRPSHFWRNPLNQRAFVEDLAKQLRNYLLCFECLQ